MQKSISEKNKQKKTNNSDLSTFDTEYEKYTKSYPSWSSLISRYMTGLDNMNKTKFTYYMIPLVATFLIPLLSTNLITVTPGIAMLYLIYISDQTDLSLFESVNISLASGGIYFLSLIAFVTTQTLSSLLLALIITSIYIVYCIVYANIVHDQDQTILI